MSNQARQNKTSIAVKDYFMENMFCKPKGLLGQLGGQLMSRDRQLPLWVLDLLEIHPSDAVLEVGSGAGLGLELASQRAHQGWVVGVDPSATMVKMAERCNRAQIEAGRIEIRLGSVEALPVEDAAFDKAMAMNSLHLWPDPGAGLRQIRCKLRSGGHIALAITRFSYASPAKFEQHLREAGFADVQIYTGEQGTCAVGRV